MQTVSSVSIVSNALVRLGESSISSFSDNDRIEGLSNIYYTQRDAILRSHPWNCAVKREVLAAKVAPAVPKQIDFANTFQLPDDLLRVLQVGERYYEPDYKIEGREILCDESPLRIRYIYKNYDESTWDAMLIEAMELAMQAALCYAVTESTTKEEAAKKQFLQYMATARAVDGMEDPPELLGDNLLLNARFRRS